ncbi:MAG TPA: ShlB/FhaC/HecB family hemolysin secretion/activation protein [Stellaceae bacterium]|nr:ShlB/FhaC/HecB family hemolysin secretion/activation protein [Stellaceae bacterium]
MPAGLAAVLLACLWLNPAAAQSPGANNPQINPGAIGNEQLRQQRQLEQQQNSPLVPQGPAVVGPERTSPELRPGGPAFLLKTVTFDPSAFLSPEELQTIAAPYIGHDATFETLQLIIKEVNALYDKRGIITASAVLPPQKVADGVVHIGLVEGKLGKVEMKGLAQTNPDYIRDRLALAQDQVVDVPALQSSVEAFNRLNDTQLKVLLQPGANFGQTDINLAIREPQRFTAELFADNQGNNTTNRDELGLYTRAAGPLGINDRLTLYGTLSQGSKTGSAAYNLPIDPWGDRFGLSYQRNRIVIVQGPFKALHISGTSQVGSVDLIHPFIATQSWLLTANLAGSDTFSKTDQSGVFVSDDQTRKGGGGLSLTNNGESYSASLTQNFARAHTRDNVLSTGRYFYVSNGTWNGYLNFLGNFSATTQAAWQYSPQKLLPGDQLFEIGGPTTVRGYQANTFAGDDGFYVNLELHYNVLPLVKEHVDLGEWVTGLDSFVFGDRGSVYSSFPQQRTLESTGFGFSTAIQQHLTGELSVGFPILHGLPNYAPYVLYARVALRY